ncbi:MAG: hypothetical protein M1812_000696 [Candelaria pacifica]|nr:MAG: hypothetical protein M1812_000696 [Candelaria pacifica]
MHRRPRPDAPPLVLLAFLALTARYHGQLVSDHSLSNRASNPSMASEFYARAALERLGQYDGGALDQPSLECLQALLMLGLYQWGIGNSYKAFRLIGDAVRMTQAMGLAAGCTLVDEQLASSSTLNIERQSSDQRPQRPNRGHTGYDAGELFLKDEIRRRTFWSCFIMDRYLSSGQPSLQMFDVEKLRIQLPCSEFKFLSKERVLTESLTKEIHREMREAPQSQRQIRPRSNVAPSSFLCNSDQAFRRGISHEQVDKAITKSEVGSSESVLSRVMKIIEIWGRVARWSCEGGRRTESRPPWDERSTFYGLEHSLFSFQHTLPEDLTFTNDHTSAYIAKGSSTPYVLMHTVYFLCLVVLHREYVPYIPWKCSKPEGPVDEPTFSPAKYDIPEGWWEESATRLFKAARSILNLVQKCRDRDVLVESFIVGFAVFLVAFVGVYCDNFPYMDTTYAMCSKSPTSSSRAYVAQPLPPSATRNGHHSKQAELAVDIMVHMRPRLKVAAEWCKTIINERDDYPSKIKRYKEAKGGGGLDLWVNEGRFNPPNTLRNKYEEVDSPASERRSTSIHDISASDAESVPVKGEAMEGVERRSNHARDHFSPIDGICDLAAAMHTSNNVSSNQGGVPIPPHHYTDSEAVQNSLCYDLEKQHRSSLSSQFTTQPYRIPQSGFTTSHTPMTSFGSPNLYSLPFRYDDLFDQSQHYPGSPGRGTQAAVLSQPHHQAANTTYWGSDGYSTGDTLGYMDALGVIEVQDTQQQLMTGF